MRIFFIIFYTRSTLIKHSRVNHKTLPYDPETLKKTSYLFLIKNQTKNTKYQNVRIPEQDPTVLAIKLYPITQWPFIITPVLDFQINIEIIEQITLAK